MRCQLVCDCGQTLDIEGSSSSVSCPQCQACYALTVTKIRQSDNVKLND